MVYVVSTVPEVSPWELEGGLKVRSATWSTVGSNGATTTDGDDTTHQRRICKILRTAPGEPLHDVNPSTLKVLRTTAPDQTEYLFTLGLDDAVRLSVTPHGADSEEVLLHRA